MGNLVSDKVSAIKLSPIRRFSNMVNNVPGALTLTIGQPDFSTPEEVKNAGIQAIKNDMTTYTANQGYMDLRKEISKLVKNNYNLHYDPADEITVTVGASQAIDVILRTIINPGDEILIPSPGYVAYEACISLSGGKPVFVPLKPEDGFKLKAQTLKEYITPKTKALLLSYPSNPTGAVMDEDDLIKLSEVIKGTHVAIISDEIYSELTYGKKHFSIASIDDMKERTIVINGFSKAYSMTGWRLGYILAPKKIMEHIVKVHQYNVSCAPSVSQAAGIEAIRSCDKNIKEMVTEYDKRRTYCHNRLKSMDLDCFEPLGAFYLFPEIKKFNLSSEEFCTRLLYEGKLAVVPGSAFGGYGEGHLRISYAYSMDILEDGLNRLQKFISKL
nr:aminotransferase class I/II-fold pyridoxal phosphate-dependent enzyme [Oxobacter pfennigii]